MNDVSRCTAMPERTDSGFTLLEITVAIFIFALLITTVFGSFRIVFSGVDAVGGDVAVYATARTCLERMAEDLTALHVIHHPRYHQPDFNDSPDPFRLVGDTTDVAGQPFGRLRFTSRAHLPINGDARQGVGRIVYYVQRRDDDTLVVRRADHLFPFPEFEENEDDPILCDHILGLEFGYVENVGTSIASWDSEAEDTEFTTPRSIDIRLTVGQPDRPITFTTRVALYAYRQSTE